MRYSAMIAGAALAAACWQPAAAQDMGAKAGNAYVPSTHTPGCGGLMCDGNDPGRQAGAPPPPPCKAIICGDTPVTASEAARINEERARQAQAAPPPEPAEPPKARKKRKVAKTRAKAATKTAAAAPK